jgi:CheY-like chemotaxis protein
MNMPKVENRSPCLLLVDDNAADILLLQEALVDSGMDIMLQVVNDGEEAMRYLYKEPPFDVVEAVLPDLILLDLNMPKKNGFAFLEEVKQAEDLKHIPIIVFSTSLAKEDINRSYRLYANAFVSKPADFALFTAAIKEIGSFWLNTVALPVSQ